VNPLAYPLLAEENIHPEVVGWLRDTGCDVRTVFERDSPSRATPKSFVALTPLDELC
jgi:hypothetical protein